MNRDALSEHAGTSEHRASLRPKPAQAAGVDAVVGLGGNLGSPVATFCRAVDLLARQGSVLALSALYQTAPVGGPRQAPFLNAALRMVFPGPLEDLMSVLLSVERALGRVRRVRWGPRTLDLDLLWAANARCLKTRSLVPHPRLLQRAFALRPLLDVAPEATEPVTGRPYIKYLFDLQGQQIRPVRGFESLWPPGSVGPRS